MKKVASVANKKNGQSNMQCRHPHCPMGGGAPSWDHLVDTGELFVRTGERAALKAELNANFNSAPANPAVSLAPPTTNQALLKRLIELCPCLLNQIDHPVQAKGVVHLCELTLGAMITSANVHDAFFVQHPNDGPTWTFPPVADVTAEVGSIMEFLCSEVLSNHGIPAMPENHDRWPVWNMPGHILMNYGKMDDLKALGDILVPCAPTNLIISVKSVKARERLLYSANSIEGIGFGFFDQPDEFSSKRRIQLFKRMGFSAIYMPQATLNGIAALLAVRGDNIADVQNIYGTALYRALSDFGGDMVRIVGKSAFDL